MLMSSGSVHCLEIPSYGILLGTWIHEISNVNTQFLKIHKNVEQK